MKWFCLLKQTQKLDEPFKSGLPTVFSECLVLTENILVILKEKKNQIEFD